MWSISRWFGWLWIPLRVIDLVLFSHIRQENHRSHRRVVTACVELVLHSQYALSPMVCQAIPTDAWMLESVTFGSRDTQYMSSLRTPSPYQFRPPHIDSCQSFHRGYSRVSFMEEGYYGSPPFLRNNNTAPP